MDKQIKTYHHKNLRPALLDEAAAMITEGGVESVTMRALGQRVGVSRAAAYRHFTDKSDLLMAVAGTGFDKLEKRIQPTLSESSLTIEEKLQRLGEEYIHFAQENPAHYRLMYGIESLNRRTRPTLKDSGDTLFALLRKVIGAFQEETGTTQKDTWILAYVAWSAVHGLASLLIEEQILFEVNVEALIHQTMCTVIDGIKS